MEVESNFDVLFFLVTESSIDDASLHEVEKQMKDKEGGTLYIVMETYGGSPFAAMAIMNLLNKRYNRIIGIVPNYAKSAGTLMLLGVDEIFMSDKAALGPLDLPIEHPIEGSRISALDVQNTIITLASLSDTIAEDRYRALRRDGFKLPKAEAAKVAYESATNFVKPIVSQIDPYHLQKSYRELKIGLFYAIDLLLMRMMKDNYVKAERTAKSLVNFYPAHEYSIFRDEARKVLKLNVDDLDELNDYGEYICDRYEDLRNKGRNAIMHIQVSRQDEMNNQVESTGGDSV